MHLGRGALMMAKVDIEAAYRLLGPPDSPECQQALDMIVQSCTQLEVPLVTHKTVSPTACLIFLGITIDIAANKLRLSSEKLARLKTLLTEWGYHKAHNQR